MDKPVFTKPEHKEAIYGMASVFNCQKPFGVNDRLTKRCCAIISKIALLLEMAFMLSEETISKSYKAYYTIYNLRQMATTHKLNIISNDEIDSIAFDAIKKSNNFNLLKENLTAFELEKLNKQAKEHDAQSHKSNFVNKFKVDRLITMAKQDNKNYTSTELFNELGCDNPFLIVPKVVNKNTNDERIEYLTHSGLKVYDKLITLIHYAHNAFDYPDITDRLDSIIDREWY